MSRLPDGAGACMSLMQDAIPLHPLYAQQMINFKAEAAEIEARA